MSAQASPRASILIVPRQQFGVLDTCLERLYASTHGVDFETVVVHLTGDGAHRLPQYEYPQLRAFESDTYLYPHEAKNLALEHASPDSEWIVFMDNDVCVHEGWLERMIAAAEAENAKVVHPLYLFERGGLRIVHMAHGEFSDDASGRRRPLMKLVNHPLSFAEGLERRDSDFVEFHCWMIHRSVLERLGPFEFVTVGEHVHHSLRLRALGERIIFEPSSVITYIADVDDDPAGRDYLRYRWSAPAARRSVRFLIEQWPDFRAHWKTKIRAAWEFRSCNEVWYPFVGGLVRRAQATKRWLRSVSAR